MDGFSVASLSTLSSSVSHRSLAAAAELTDLLRKLPSDHHVGQLSSLSKALQAFSTTVNQLAISIISASAISQRLQAQLSRSLGTCENGLVSLGKQVMRLQPETITSLNEAFLTVHDDILLAYTQLFGYFEQVLAMTDKEDQDASLDSQEGRRIIEQVDDMLKLVPKVAGDILIDGSNSAPTRTSTEAGPPGVEGSMDSPPPYEPPTTEPSAASPSGPSTSSPPATQSSNFWDLTSIKQSFSALTAGLRSKPDPLVSALCEASRRGDVSQMAGLLKHGANIDGKNEDRETPLHCAIMANQDQAVRLLLASGADLKTWSKMPAMFLAASVGHISIARMLLQRGGPGTDVKTKNVSGQQYFVDVVGSGNIDGVRFLLEHGADARAKSISGRPVVVQAAKKGSLGLVKLLFDFGADVNAADVTGASLVSLALEKSDMDLMELLLTRGAKPDSRCVDGERVLATAISKRKVPFAKRLMQAGADGNVDDITGQKVIINVVKGSKIENNDKVELVRMLLQNGAKATSKDIFWPHMQALPLAVDNGVDGEVVAMLLRYGADSTKTLHNGETPLTEAINKGRMDQIEALLANGADPNLANTNDKTPLILALVRQDLTLVRLLRQHGAEVDSPGQSAREFAMTLGQPDILQVLGLVPGPGSSRDQ